MYILPELMRLPLLDNLLNLVAFMRDRPRKAESVRWRVLNLARQRTGPVPATLSIIFMLFVLHVVVSSGFFGLKDTSGMQRRYVPSIAQTGI